MTAFMEAFTELAEAGRACRDPGWQRRCTPGAWCENGTPFVTDGPYAETQEVLAGYWIVECDSFDRGDGDRQPALSAPEHVVANAYADVRPIMESAADID